MRDYLEPLMPQNLPNRQQLVKDLEQGKAQYILNENGNSMSTRNVVKVMPVFWEADQAKVISGVYESNHGLANFPVSCFAAVFLGRSVQGPLNFDR